MRNKPDGFLSSMKPERETLNNLLKLTVAGAFLALGIGAYNKRSEISGSLSSKGTYGKLNVPDIDTIPKLQTPHYVENIFEDEFRMYDHILDYDGRKISEIYKKAVGGDSRSAAIYGEILRRGDVVSENQKEALKWLKIAEKNNEPMAYYNLAVMYENGFEIKKDSELSKKYDEKAFSLMEVLAKTGNIRANADLGYMHVYRAHLNNDITETKVGISYLEKAAYKGHIAAIEKLISIYKFGKGVERDHEKVRLLNKKYIKMLESQSKKGDVRCIEILAGIYSEGDITDKDSKKAYELWKTTLGFDYPRSYYFLGDKASEMGFYKLAKYWFMQSAEFYNDPAAYFRLGYLYQHGNLEDKNDENRKKYYMKAALLGVPKAELILAHDYMKDKSNPESKINFIKCTKVPGCVEMIYS